MKKTLRAAFPLTIPVLTGYTFLGIAYGLLMQKAGFGIGWTLLCSLTIFSGTAQYLGVSLLAMGAPIAQVALLTFILNFRYFFYGLSLIGKYRNKGFLKGYLIHAITDETYAILVGARVPDDVDEKKFYLAVSALDHMYWVVGSAIGVTVGSLITFDLTGIDFVMTALFAVLVVEQWKSNRCHIPAIIGGFVSVVVLVILGPDNFLIPTLLVITLLLILFRKPIEARENSGEGAGRNE